MNIKLQNECSQYAKICIRGTNAILIPPWKSVSVELENMHQFQITLRNNSASHCKGGRYVFTIETVYSCGNVRSDTCFAITREKVRVDDNGYFDRLLISSNNAVCIPEIYHIADEVGIRKEYEQKKIMRFLVTDPLENLTGLFFAFILLGMIVAFALGWLAAIIYFLCGYVLLVIINACIDSFWKQIIEKRINHNVNRIDFEDFFTDGFVLTYYSNPDRKPYMGEIETY